MFVSEKFNDLVKKYEENKLSHAFLFETNNIDSCYDDIKQFLKVINCPGEFNENCNEECNLCNLIDKGNLPNIITIEPDGANIKKYQFEELIDKFSTKPVFSKYNSYIVKNANLMNDSSANCILKFLEEPSDNIIGFFITLNKESMLDTIKSRCQIIKVLYNQEENNFDNIKNVADEYLDKVLHSDDYFINKDIILSIFDTREDINNIFLYYLDLYNKEISKNYFLGNKNKLFEGIEFDVLKKQLIIIENILHFNRYNVNLELLLDKFVIEMRRLND